MVVVFQVVVVELGGFVDLEEVMIFLGGEVFFGMLGVAVFKREFFWMGGGA